MTAAPSALSHASRSAGNADSVPLPFFALLADSVSRVAGRPVTFAPCCFLIVIWVAAGPMFHYFDASRRIINTATTIITFLKVFPIQNTQNRDDVMRAAGVNEAANWLCERSRRIGG